MKFKYILLAAVLLLPLSVRANDIQIEDAFSPYQGATSLVVHTIGKAHKSIRVAAYLLTSHPVANALIKAERNGVDVKILVDKQQSEVMGSQVAYLADNGVAVRKNGRYTNMHNKFMVIDDAILELGSFNYTRTAEEQNAENVMVIRGAPDIAKAYLNQWKRLWDEGE